MSKEKESRVREFYVDTLHLNECDKDLDLGEGKPCRVVYYPHKDHMWRLTKVISFNAYQSILAKVQAYEAALEIIADVSCAVGGDDYHPDIARKALAKHRGEKYV